MFKRLLLQLLLLAVLLGGCVRIDPINGFSFTGINSASTQGSLATQLGIPGLIEANDVGSGHLKVLGYTIEPSSGKTAATLKAGETATLTFRIKNTADRTLGYAYFNVSTSNSYATITKDWSSYSSGKDLTPLNAGAIAEAKVTIMVSSSIPSSQASIMLTATLADADTGYSPRSVSIPITVSTADVKLIVDSYQVLDSAEGNGDGQFNPGERASLQFRIKNTGSDTAPGLSIKASLSDINVSQLYGGLGSESSIGDLAPGTFYMTANALEVRAVQGISSSYQFTVSLIVKASQGQEWTLPVVVTLAPASASLTLDSYELSGGDGDLIIERGERINLTFRLKNNGTSKAKGVKLTATVSGSSYVTKLYSYPSEITVGDIAPGASANAISSFTFDVSSGTPTNHPFSVQLTMSDALGNEWTGQVALTVQ